MSGIVVDNVARTSGTIAPTAGGLSWESAIITGSTVTVEGQNGYYIDTTSNVITVTLPASPAVGDQIVLVDYARYWSSNAMTIDSNGNNFQGQDDSYTVDYATAGSSISIVYADDTKGWIPISDDATGITDDVPVTQRAIFAFGVSGGTKLNNRNLVNTNGVVASDATGAGTARTAIGGTNFGGDKAIFGFGTAASGQVALSNLVNNTGVIASDQSASGTAAVSSLEAKEI